MIVITEKQQTYLRTMFEVLSGDLGFDLAANLECSQTDVDDLRDTLVGRPFYTASDPSAIAHLKEASEIAAQMTVAGIRTTLEIVENGVRVMVRSGYYPQSVERIVPWIEIEQARINPLKMPMFELSQMGVKYGGR